MRAWKLQRGGGQRNAKLCAGRFDGRDTRDNVWWRRRVIEIRRRAIGRVRAAGEYSGVVRTTEHDADLAPMALRQQFGERGLVEQRVAAGQQDQVEVGMAQGLEARVH